MNEKEDHNILQRAETVVKEHYDLGEVLSVGELEGGYINRSFVVHVKRNDIPCKYMVRRYNPANAEDDIQFEHALVSHLRKNGFLIAAGVIPKKNGGTYAKEQLTVEGRTAIRFWAVFEFLKSEIRYAFMDTNLSEEELTSAADTLARLHEAGRNFCNPSGINRRQPKVMDFLPTFRQAYAEYTKEAGKTHFDQCFLKHRDEILEKVDHTLIPDADLDRMPQLPIHGDYNQGNLTYEGLQVIGVFDFDWSRIDMRLFDLAQSLVYFCACWDGQEAGSIDLDKCVLFLRSYNEGCKSAAIPGPLNAVEQANMTLMLAAANLFVLHCIIHYYYKTEDPDVEGWLAALNHYLSIMHWIEAQKGRIAEMTYMACTEGTV